MIVKFSKFKTIEEISEKLCLSPDVIREVIEFE